MVIDAERARLEAPRPAIAVTAQKILELAIQAENLYKSHDPTDQRRLLETVLSNCSFDRGTLSPTYRSPFDLFVQGNQTGDWRGRRDSNPIFSTTIDSDRSRYGHSGAPARCGQQAADDDRTSV
jgi:hypothetical protein